MRTSLCPPWLVCPGGKDGCNCSLVKAGALMLSRSLCPLPPEARQDSQGWRLSPRRNKMRFLSCLLSCLLFSGMASLDGGHRHLDFRRLLKAAERCLESGPLATASLVERVYVLELNRFGVYVTALREQLSELYTMEVGTIPAVTLQQYGLRLDALERSLFARQQELRTQTAAAANLKAESSQVDLTMASPGIRQRSPVGGRPAGAPSSPTGEGLMGVSRSKKGADDTRGREDGVTRDEREVLSRQKEEQHRLKMQLEDLVASLKASSTLIYSNLRDQNQVLDKTGEAAVKNLEGLEQDIKKTEEQLRRAWGNTFTSCLMILVVLATFVATFLFMRLFPKRRLLLW